MVYLGADHRGFKLKAGLLVYLREKGYKVIDVGPLRQEPDDDYPIYTEKAARKVVEDPNNRGILICGSGAGVCIGANKIKGIRAAVAWNPEIAKAVRHDDNANVLCLAADFTDLEQAQTIVQNFLDASFGGEEKYKKRLREIANLENG